MPTVIDELIVVLGLDATKFTQGQKQAVDQWAKTREAAKRHSQDMAKDTEGVTEAVSALSRRLLGLGALFLGGLGVKNFTDDIKRLALEMTNLSRAATNAGTSAQSLKTFQNIGATIGVDPSSITASMTALRDQIAQFRVFATGNTAIAQFLSKMGMTATDFDTPEKSDAALKKMNRYAAQLRGQGVLPPEINAFFGAGGFDKGMSALLQLDPKKFDELMLAMKKYAPSAEDIEKFKKLTAASAESTAALDKLGTVMKAQLAGPLSDFYKWWTSVINFYLFGTKEGKAPTVPNAEGLELPGANVPAPSNKGGGFGKLGELYKGGAFDLIPGAHASTGGSESGGTSIGSSGNISMGSGGLAGDREKYFQEMKNNPEVRRRLLAISAAENNDPKANLAVMETMMNRASSRGTTLAEQLKFYGRERGGYYPTANYGALNDPKKMSMYEANLERARGGSNVSGYATDNSSGSLAYRDEASGAFIKTIPTQNGESFFSPGNRGRGSASRESYLKWRQSIEQSSNNAFDRGTSAIPYSDWLTNASTRNLMRQSNITTNNNRTSSETTVGNINVHTQATDAYGIARDLKPYIENNKTTTPFNYGPN